MIEIMNFRTNKAVFALPYDVRVDRKSHFGNQFYMAYESDRNKVCNAYKDWFDDYIRAGGKKFDKLGELYKKHGKLRLWCWCAPKRCHAETIRDYILAQSS